MIEEVKFGEGPLDFKADAEDRILWVVGGPGAYAVANHADFFSFPGQEAVAKPELRDVIDLRGKRSVHLDRGDVWWPGPQPPDKTWVPKGSRPRLMRLMPIAADLPAARIAEQFDKR